MKSKLFLSAVSALFFLLPVSLTSLSVPELINYQGRLNDSSGQPVDGDTVDMTFTFYGSETGDTALLIVVQEDVLVTKGIYNVLIGSGTITAGTENSLADVFQKRNAVWMGVKVGVDSEMTPRSRITSVPYSLATDKDFLAKFIGTFTSTPDWDGDGHLKAPIGTDCNDWLATVFPCAPEICDNIDNQCPGCGGYGLVDEGCDPPWFTIYDLDPIAGIGNGGAAGTLTIIVGGVRDNYPVYDRYNMINDPPSNFGEHITFGGGIYVPIINNLINPPYITVVKILNDTFADINLANEGLFVELLACVGAPCGEPGSSLVPLTVALPGDTIPDGYTLPLYVANDGSSYYMVPDQGGGVHSLDLAVTWNGPCTLGDAWPFPPYCPTVKPPDAWADPAAP